MTVGHGKVILMGEHAVVFGHPAIAVAIEQAAQVSWEPSETGTTTLLITPGDTRVDTGPTPSPDHPLLKDALKLARSMYPDARELSLHARMSIPKGAGVGSSAALGVGILRAMDAARGASCSDSELFARSFAWEAVFHGTPGGIDNYMATHGGLVLFRRAYPLCEGVPIWQQITAPRVVPCKPLRLLVADSGSRPPAIEMILGVGALRKRNPRLVNGTFEAIALVVMNAKLAIEEGKLERLGQLLDTVHMLLARLLLVSERVEQMVQAARFAGALGAKMTGAGGGGCMIALVDSDERAAAVTAALAPFGTVFEAIAK